MQNELGLACEILADYATTHPQAAEFWLALHDAALQMGMSEQAEECQQLAEGQEPPL